MLKERASYYYGTLGKNCAEGILLAANEVYGLKLTDQEIQLFSGFGRGMGCGSTCGGLSGAIGVLSRMYGGREDFRELCGGFVSKFKDALGCDTIDCGPLAGKYKTEAARCVSAVELTAQALEEYIALQLGDILALQAADHDPLLLRAAEGLKSHPPVQVGGGVHPLHGEGDRKSVV